MRTRDEFFRIMEQQTEIALATSADNVPNVRIVNFYFDPQKGNENKFQCCFYHHSTYRE